MKVAVYGLGYVGSVTATCLADAGHDVIGIDVQASKVDAVNAGISPVLEPGLDVLLKTVVENGRLKATTDVLSASVSCDVHIICVGTPSAPNGKPNLDYVHIVSGQIADALKDLDQPAVIVYRSTMLPGSTRQLYEQFFQNLPVEILFCPEFLREGSALSDFKNPSLSALGTMDGKATLISSNFFPLLGFTGQPVTWETAEMIKYSCNFFHALKVGFANEVGRLCKASNIDARDVMNAVCEDTRLNISTQYLKPANAFGGSCLPKDLRALNAMSRTEGVAVPLLEHTINSNQAHLDMLIQLVQDKGVRKIGLLGLAFKADTDDLRGSPMVALAETLLGRGYELSIYDPGVDLPRLVGRNANEIHQRMPHLAKLLKHEVSEVIKESDLVVVSQRCASVPMLEQWARKDQWVIDAAGWKEIESLDWKYEGICW